MIARGVRTALAAVLGLFALLATAGEPLRIGAEDDWAPFSSGKDGVPSGMAVELVRAIFAEAGIPITLVALPYARCMNETRAGRVAGCFNTVPDDKLRREYLFHARPLFTLASYIVAPATDKAERLSTVDLRGKRVAVPTGYNYGDEFESDPAIQRQNVLSDLSAMRMVAAGRADYTVIYAGVLDHLLRGPAADLKDRLKVVGEIRQKNELYLSFSRAQPGLPEAVRQFDAAHARLQAKGTLAEIMKRYK